MGSGDRGCWWVVTASWAGGEDRVNMGGGYSTGRVWKVPVTNRVYCFTYST